MPAIVLLKNGVQLEYLSIFSVFMLCFLFSLMNLIDGDLFSLSIWDRVRSESLIDDFRFFDLRSVNKIY